MSLISRLLAKIYKLPPAETYNVGVEKNLQVPMPDGVMLLADHYYPRNLGERPTILVRTVYGKDVSGFLYRFLAERGFHVLIQCTRGTFGSGGELDPFRQEHDDGVAAIEWIKKQAWFNGSLGMTGTSYLGFTQWTVARDAGSMLKAMSTRITSSDFRSALYTGHAFALEAWLLWINIIHTQNISLLRNIFSARSTNRKLKAALRHLPLAEADRIAFDRSYKFWQEWVEHEQPDSTYWAERDYSSTAGEIAAPNHLVSGWYEIFLQNIIKDYMTLKKAGRKPYLTIGPWTHFSFELGAFGMREEIYWLRAHLLGDTGYLRTSPVRLYVMGADEWRDYPEWPPAGFTPRRLHLHPDGCLAAGLPPASEADRYSYNPADPTPSVGGMGTALGGGEGAMDNRKLETRPDVLTYTGEVLEQDVEAIGPVSAELYVQSGLVHTDFFVRLCDVDPSGKSLNICEGIVRLGSGQLVEKSGECLKVCIELTPMAYRFCRGHRIRVQVSSGAFPRWNRNLGSGEPLATGTTMRIARQSVFHDPACPSAIILPLAD